MMKTVKELWYRVPEVCFESTYRLGLDRERRIDKAHEREDLAEACAENYYSFHDGFDCSWPLIITLHESEGSEAFAAIRVRIEGPIQYRGNELDRADLDEFNQAARKKGKA